jgi:hypothetical protein
VPAGRPLFSHAAPGAGFQGRKQRGEPHCKCLLFLDSVCVTMMRSSLPGAQTERRGDAGPVRVLLGGGHAPAVFPFLPDLMLPSFGGE